MLKNQNNKYKVYYINQNNKKRRIEQPNKTLKEKQKKILENLEKEVNYLLPSFCMCKKGKSIKDNAICHEQAKYVLKIDLSKCYNYITPRLVKKGLKRIKQENIYNKYNMNELFFYDKYKKCFILPTGSPTSPLLCNLALVPLDNLLYSLGYKYGYVYTRYIDDICFSTTSDNRKWELLETAAKIIKNYGGLKINKKKTKWLTVNNTDYVVITGIRIGQKHKIPRNIRQKTSNLLFKHKVNNTEFSDETKGYLAHIYSIDQNVYHKLIEKYK